MLFNAASTSGYKSHTAPLSEWDWKVWASILHFQALWSWFGLSVLYLISFLFQFINIIIIKQSHKITCKETNDQTIIAVSIFKFTKFEVVNKGRVQVFIYQLIFYYTSNAVYKKCFIILYFKLGKQTCMVKRCAQVFNTFPFKNFFMMLSREISTCLLSQDSNNLLGE